MLCPNCGKEILDEASSCTFCGEPLCTTETSEEEKSLINAPTTTSSEQDTDASQQSDSDVSPTDNTDSQQSANPGKDFGIVALTLGLVSLICCSNFYTGVPGIIFGFIGYSRSKKANFKNPMALTGIILSLAAIVIEVLLYILYYIFLISVAVLTSLVQFL